MLSARQRLCLASNGCAVFYMPLLIFSRSTLTSPSKDNWQFMTRLFHLMSQMGKVAAAGVVFKPQRSFGGETHVCAHANTMQFFNYPG